MSYKEKYLKYKEKYLKLKKQIGGNDVCVMNEIFDLDCFIPLTTNPDKDFIFRKRLSKETIDFIREDIQQYYNFIYNFMAYPNLPHDILSNKDLLHTINIPIIDNQLDTHISKVDYVLLATKLNNIGILEMIEIEKNKKQAQTVLDDQVDNFKEYVKLKKQNTELYNTVTYEEIELLDKFKSIYTSYNDLQQKLFNYITNNKLTLIANNKWNSVIDSWNEFLEKFKQVQELRNKLSEINKKLHKFKNERRIHHLDLLHYNENIEKIKEPETKIRQLFENKKRKLTEDILNNFNKKTDDGKRINCQIIKIILQYYNDKPNELGELTENSHANSVVIYRFEKNGQDHYLCLRTEPHRHTNIYCRNSVRKAIRNIFSNMPNSYFLDYIINTRKGLQVNEQQEIDKQNLKKEIESIQVNEQQDIDKQNVQDFQNLPEDIKQLSPLQGNSGFCASWTMYTTFILLLNRHISLDKLGEYFTTFDHKLDTLSQSEKFLQEFNKCFNPNKSTQQTQQIQETKPCRTKEKFIEDISGYTNLKVWGNRYIPPYSYNTPYEDSSQSTLKYILVKQIKLYRMIIFMLYYNTRKLKKTEVFDKIQNKTDKQILTEIFNDFDKNTQDIVKERLIEQSKVKIEINDNILNRDTHLCDDNLFQHIDFCLNEDVVKPIPTPDKWNCNNSKLKIDNNILLKALGSSTKEIEQYQQDNYKQTMENLDQILPHLFK